MKRIYITILCALLFMQGGYAQGPKWVTKAKKAVFSLMTFDKEDKLLNTGNGFFISETGVGVSDFGLLKGAYRAVAVDTDGKELPVLSILGADDTFDVVKFQVDLSNVKKTHSLNPYKDSITVGAEVLVIPYSTQNDRVCRPGMVKEVSTIRNNHKYYTFDLRLKETLYSCPVLTTSGDVIGIIQKEYGEESDMIAHAVDIHFIKDQEVSALSFGDLALKDIHIKKGLPLDEDDALVYLFMAGSTLNYEQNVELYGDYIKQFPNSIEGYIRRSQLFLGNAELTDGELAQAEQDIKQALSLIDTSSDEPFFTLAKAIYGGSFNPKVTDSPLWNLDNALKYIDKAIAIKPMPIYTQFKGDILMDLDRLDEALLCYEEVNNSDMASAQSFYRVAMIKEKMDEPISEVLALLDSCVNQLKEPYDMEAAPFLFERGRVKAEAELYREAMVDLEDYHYCVNGQVNANFYYFREQIAVKAKMYQHALDDITRAVELDGDEMLYQSEYAALNIRVGRYQEALKMLEKLLSKETDYAEGYRLQGVAFSQLKDDRACASFKKAKELGDPLVDGLIEKYCK